MTQTDVDENLVVIAAVEGYSSRHHMKASEAFRLFQKYQVLELLRSQYKALFAKGLDESIRFAEDILERKMA